MEAGGTFIPAGYKGLSASVPTTPDRRASGTPSPPNSPNAGKYDSCKSFANGIFASGSRYVAAVKTEDGHTRFLGKHDSRTDACHAVQDYLKAINQIEPKQMFHYY